jgi:hypothetical protein
MQAGNLTNQGDRTPNANHVFGYDALDRLTSWSMGEVLQESYGYNAIGNLTSKTGLGTLSYPDRGPGSVRPHAVTSVSAGPVAEYDTNGNMTCRWNGVWCQHVNIGPN